MEKLQVPLATSLGLSDSSMTSYDFFIEDALQGLLEGKSVALAKTLGNRARFWGWYS